MLTFHKKDQAAQDKMSIIDTGVLQIERDQTGSVLRYHLISRSLLFCFLAPLLFVGFAMLTILIGDLETSADDAAKKEETELSKKADKKNAQLPQSWIDEALGAPAPEKPQKDADKSDGEEKKPQPTTAYVFAALFAILYVFGRILEDRLIRSLFRRRLQGA